MQITEILDHVVRKIQDSSYERSPDLLAFANMGLGEIATEIVLPSLLTSHEAECTADGFSIAMPEDFLAHLRFAHNLTKEHRVKVYYSFNIFLERFSGLDHSGNVDAVCEHGGKLYYQCVPSSTQTVRIWYSKAPTLFTADNTDEPDFLPAFLHGPLLINYIAMRVYEEIEDEGKQPNFTKYFNLYSKAKASLINFVGLPDEAPEFVPDHSGIILDDAELGSI